jgi:S-DNA-T family DNA segregation ATPase FtsK/SpoIIIE
LVEAETLPMCPVTVDLNQGLAVGIVGPRDAARPLAGAIVSQLVTEHGPADVQLAVLVDDAAARHWDHLKWLPHLSDEAGARRVATSPDGAEALVERTTREPERTLYRADDNGLETPVPVFLVDHAGLVTDGVRSLASRIPRVTARAVVLADGLADLPAFCTTVVEIDPVSGLIAVTDVAKANRTGQLIGLFPHPESGRDLSRALARFVDPDGAEHAVSLPTVARWRDLAETRPEPGSVLEAWSVPAADRRTKSDCRAILGVTETGPLEVDLISDGPHALIAGTTGAGKSELLRTMIVSLAVHHRPDEVNFVLIDFKGGGAFDVFDRLPHNVGVVTDLDEHLASRALRCLRAELKYREHRLREAGVSDLRDLADTQPGGDTEPLPRLVIVVDEFATLAAELPEFLSSLVDVAQRGRSLGIHMVLATQRPSGVVDAKIRANTNLRIALRVQDDGDSIDVIGTKAGAVIDRRHPGRALARFGAGEVVGFQTALVSVRSDDATGPALRLDTFELRPDGTENFTGDRAVDRHDTVNAVQDESGPGRADGPDDLSDFVDASAEAARRLALPPPRVPWPDPLPRELAAETLLAETPERPWAVPFGLVDLPDRQRQEPAWWQAEDGNVLVYGLGPGPTSAAVSTMVVGLARRHHADQLHVYVLDFVGSLAALRGLPHLGGYITAEDDERLLRTIGMLEDELTRRQTVLRRNQLDAITPETADEFGLPLTVLAVANYGAVLEMFEELGELGGPHRLARIIRDGPSLGVFVFIAAGSERDVPGRVAQQIEAKLITRMADPNAYLMFGLRPKDLPELGPGRAIDVRHGHELQIAQFEGGDLRTAVECHRWRRTRGGPRLVEELGHDIDFARLDGASVVDGPVWHLSIGVEHERLEPVGLDLRNGQHLMVTGPAGSGRTTALHTLAAAARQSDPKAVICIISQRPEEWSPLTATLDLTDIDHLLSPDSADLAGRRALIIVDGVEGSSVPAEPFAQLADDTESRIHLAVGGRPDGFRTGADPWIRAVARSRSGIALQPTAEAGDVFHCRFPVARQVHPPGRAFVVNQGRAQLSQIAVVRTEPASNDVGPLPTQ